jgi:hypothetical protein
VIYKAETLTIKTKTKFNCYNKNRDFKRYNKDQDLKGKGKKVNQVKKDFKYNSD